MLISQSLEYRRLPIQFNIFTLSAVWCPNDWKQLHKLLYRFYTAIQIMAGILFWLTMLINIIITRNKSEYFYENLFAISTLSHAMYKEVYVLRNRRTITELLKLCFEDEWYQPQDFEEVSIIKKYEHETRWITQIYAVGIIAGLATKAITPMLLSKSAWILPIEAWYPYNIDNLLNYLFTYVQQLLGGIPLICLHISLDSLFVGLILQLCIQLNIFKKRLQTYINSANTSEIKVDAILATYAYKHERILQIGKQINKDFLGIMTSQVMIIIPNICINVYLLSQYSEGFNLHLIDSFFCFSTCSMQIFLYCWYGNKIILHSLEVSDAAYGVNWLALSTSSRKDLLTIMIRATRSIRFSAGTFIMNINSFIEIIKSSYSAYRVLQTTS